MLKQTQQKLPVDSSRIYVMGHSNGAVFASFPLLSRPAVVAAAVAHSGLYDAGRFSLPTAKAPLFVIWGAKDPLAPLESDDVQLLLHSYRNRDIPLETYFIPNWGHPWGGTENRVEEKALAFLFAHRLGEKEATK